MRRYEKRGQRWSDQDVEILKRMVFRGESVKDTAKALYRTHGAVRCKYRELCLWRFTPPELDDLAPLHQVKPRYAEEE
jgi:hypothetical protein